MFKYLPFIFLSSLIAFTRVQASAQRAIPFDDNWLFLRGDDASASQPTYNDAAWRKVDLPHDFSIEDLPNQSDTVRGPFAKSSIGAGATGYTVGGIGWYRKKFAIPASQSHKQVYIYFDGIYMYSDVWLNGHYLGSHPYGYSPFYYNITPYLNATGENVIAVKASNLGHNSRWYSGSGMYRHVSLMFTEPVHLAPWGLYVTTPEITNGDAVINVQATLQNTLQKSGHYTVTTYITTPSGKAIAGALSKGYASGNDTVITQKIILPHAQLWSPETPSLYTVKVVIKDGAHNIDSAIVKTGVRTIQFTTAGFMLNGKRTILRGGCVHHDNGPLGAEAFADADSRKLSILKANGYNAIRTSHNPPSQAFLDICDSLGLMVMDEFFDEWEEPKLYRDTSAYHYHFKQWWQKDVDAIMLRDRNHPSIVLWSIGNEIHERSDTDGVRIARELVDETHRMDATRPVTEAVCHFWGHPGRPWDSTFIAFAPLDVAGYNYEWKQYEAGHAKYPNRIMLGTESYPADMLENYTDCEKLPYVTGDFIWTAVDYMGETGIGHTSYLPANGPKRDGFLKTWPWYNAWCGDIDITGFKKPQSYYRDIVWRLKPVEMLVHAPVPDGTNEYVSGWGWPDEQHSWEWPGQEGKTLRVRVFTRSPVVRIELNGKLIGEKHLQPDSIAAAFEVPYQPGVLKAIAMQDGKVVGSVILSTPGKAQQLRLTADKHIISATRNSLSYVTVELTDMSKSRVETADVPVHFSITGAGEIAVVGNAKPDDMSSFQQPVKYTYRGRCIAIIRSTGKPGKIILTATAEGFAPKQITIEAK